MVDVGFINDNGIGVVRMEGRLDDDTSMDFQDYVVSLCDGVDVMVFNMTDVHYVSSAGLRALMGVANGCLRVDTRFGVSNLVEMVQHVFDVSGFDKVLAVYPTQEEAVDALMASAARGRK